jgi:REP-associated tyrosine transposase
MPDRQHSPEVTLARLPRYAAPGMAHHVIQRGNNRSVMFAARADYRFLHRCLRDACERHGCRVHTYAFMTNHFHLLMSATTTDGVSRAMQAVGRRYVRRFNDRYRRTGTLWEGRFRATVVDTDQYLLMCYRYIELNPVRGGLAASPDDYFWSSYRANALGRRDLLVTPHECYLALGADPRRRQAAHRAQVDDGVSDSTLEEIRSATNGGWALGSARFREEIAALLGRRTQPATRGRRPRRNDEIRL